MSGKYEGDNGDMMYTDAVDAFKEDGHDVEVVRANGSEVYLKCSKCNSVFRCLRRGSQWGMQYTGKKTCA